MNDRARRILIELETVRENLLALSDDIWLNIDHNDQKALEAGTAFKRAFNERSSALHRAALDLSALVQEYTQLPGEPDLGAKVNVPKSENERIIRALDHRVPHTLTESFLYKRPYGFVFRGVGYRDVLTWRRMYLLVCQELYSSDPQRFRTLVFNQPGARSWRLRQRPDDLLVALKVADGVYAEGNRSADDIRQQIARLLTAFNIDLSEFTVYFSEDRNAEP